MTKRERGKGFAEIALLKKSGGKKRAAQWEFPLTKKGRATFKRPSKRKWVAESGKENEKRGEGTERTIVNHHPDLKKKKKEK